MSSDRSVSTDALASLGMLAPADAGRDAIHLAVEPVVAIVRVYPGQHVDSSGTPVGTKVGIVDPYLTTAVEPGQRFWLFVYPRQITSLRHVWSHPAFSEEAPERAGGDSIKAASEKWMRAWAIEHMGDNYYGPGRLSDEIAFANALEAGSNNHIGPYESARDYIDNEWWNHWEAITGKRGDRDAYFSCSC